MIKPLNHWSPLALNGLNWGVILGSVLLCSLLLPLRLPGLELAGVGPNWLLIWLVTWSLKRSAFQGVVAGISLGLIQDGLTAPNPTHTIGLALVGLLTGRLNKKRFIEEDLISVALIVFCMAVLVETIMAIQFSVGSENDIHIIWSHQQKTALSSAILSSLWTPVISYPLNRWWQQFNQLTGHE